MVGVSVGGPGVSVSSVGVRVALMAGRLGLAEAEGLREGAGERLGLEPDGKEEVTCDVAVGSIPSEFPRPGRAQAEQASRILTTANRLSADRRLCPQKFSRIIL